MNPEHISSKHEGIDAQLLELFLYLGSEWILYLLLVLSVFSIALAMERCVFFMSTRDDLKSLQESLENFLKKDKLDEAKKMLLYSRSSVARITLKGLESIKLGVLSVEEIIAGATKTEKARMERGLSFLGTLGNNAPFIGLFGTVLGIVRAFRDLSTQSAESTSAVMAGISEALIATAVGLLVALPAVFIFNMFQRMIKNRLNYSSTLTHILLAYIKSDKKL